MLIIGEQSRRGQWPKGIIEETYSGPDGVVRSARVRTESSSIVRAIRKLCLLEGSDETHPYPDTLDNLCDFLPFKWLMLFYVVQCETLTFVSFDPFDRSGYLKFICNLDFVKLSAQIFWGRYVASK